MPTAWGGVGDTSPLKGCCTATWVAVEEPSKNQQLTNFPALSGALGCMVEQTKAGVSTEIQYAPSGFKMQMLSGQTVKNSFVPLPGGTVFVPQCACYFDGDWLGGSRFSSTYFNRTMKNDLAYAPYGEQYAAAGAAPLGLGNVSFAGNSEDTATNLYDAQFREYEPFGRWPSPDPAGVAAANPANPQSWNRYAYALNSPLNLIDPSGLCAAQFFVTDVTIGGVLVAESRFFLGYVDCGSGGDDSGGGHNGHTTPGPKPPGCTGTRKAAANLAKLLNSVSDTLGEITFASGVATAVAFAGEEPTLGLDTSFSASFVTLTALAGKLTFATGAAAAALNSFVGGNSTALREFDFSQLTNLAAKLVASKISFLKPLAERIGDLAEQAADLSAGAGGCQ